MSLVLEQCLFRLLSLQHTEVEVNFSLKTACSVLIVRQSRSYSCLLTLCVLSSGQIRQR